MKWFHHDSAARHDPKLQILGAEHGPEGWGIFWALLEEIAQHSDTFHLKVTEFSKKSDKSFANLLKNPQKESGILFDPNIDLNKIPRLPVRTLARNLFTTSKTLTSIIGTCTQVDLFDRQKWQEFNVLHSPSFEHRADDYTRRVQRRTFGVRTGSEQTSDTVRSLSEEGSDNVRTLSEQNPKPVRRMFLLETEQEQKEKRSRTEKDLSVRDAKGTNLISTCSQHGLANNDNHLIELSPEAFLDYSGRVRSQLSSWNDGRSNKFDWNPTEPELRKLFLGGDQLHKQTLCYSAYNLLGEKIHYAELVIRAVQLMLKASEKTRITNPFGWMWTCLHGNGDGTHPWVQLLTADEEDSLASRLRTRVRDNHPP